MVKIINNGPYLAGRLAYFREFKKGYGLRRWKISEKIPDALSEGKVIISNLEFQIKTVNKQFIVSVFPVKKYDWSKFEKHIERLKGEDFWKMDGYNSQLKESIRNIEFFVNNRREEFKDREKFMISGSFLNYNNEYSARYLIETIVKPLIQCEDFI